MRRATLAADADDPAHRLGAHRPLPPAQRQRPARCWTRRSRSPGSPPRWWRACEVDAERWARAAREGFTAAADVADVLAVEAGLDYRTAHHVVGRAVRDLVEAGLAPDALTPERLAAAAQETIGRPVAIAAEVLAAALDPAACAAARLQTGSSAPGEVAAMIAAVRAQAADGRAFSAAARERAARADAALLARARELAGG